MIGRRKFMQAFGFGAMAVPKVAEEEMKKLTSLRGWDVPPLHQAMPHAAKNVGLSPIAPTPGNDQFVKAWTYFRSFGIPEYVKDQVRDDTRYVTFLDVDIATKRSWSLSYKILQQRQRNYDRALAEKSPDRQWRQNAMKKFMDATGFYWPW